MEVKNLKNIAHDKPVILAPNHVNAFIDPSIMAVLCRQKVRFFARSDVFNSKLKRVLLNDLNVSPMYRMQEGYGEIKKNNLIFEECKRLLSANKTILIFPEGICILERRLKKLKKGLARIIFNMEEAFDSNKEILVVPIGLNYSNAPFFGSKLLVNIGEPLSLKQFEHLRALDKVKSINEFTGILEKSMAELLVIVKNPHNEDLYEVLQEMYGVEDLKPRDYNNLEKEHDLNRKIAGVINDLDENNPIGLQELKDKSLSYHKKLEELKIQDFLLHRNYIEAMNFFKTIGQMLLLILGMPLFILGMLTNYPPYWLGKRIADKVVTNVEFYASIYANMSMVLWLLYYGLQVLTIGLLFKNWTLLGLYSLIVPLLGLYSRAFNTRLQKMIKELRLLRIVKIEPQTIETLLYAREEIMQRLKSLMK